MLCCIMLSCDPFPCVTEHKEEHPHAVCAGRRCYTRVAPYEDRNMRRLTVNECPYRLCTACVACAMEDHMNFSCKYCQEGTCSYHAHGTFYRGKICGFLMSFLDFRRNVCIFKENKWSSHLHTQRVAWQRINIEYSFVNMCFIFFNVLK